MISCTKTSFWEGAVKLKETSKYHLAQVIDPSWTVEYMYGWIMHKIIFSNLLS